MKLTAAKRHALPNKDFAVPGNEGLPIDTPGRTRAAMARFNQYEFDSKAQAERAYKRIGARAKKFKIDDAHFKEEWKGFTMKKNPHRAMRRNPLEPSAIGGVAKALWIPAWADHQDEIGGENPGPGGDWVDIAPEPSEEVMDQARGYILKLERANKGKTLVSLLMEAARADGVEGDEFDDEYAEDFGFYITMQGLGHGVAWDDDHAAFPIKVPDVEAYYDGESLMVSM